LSYCSSRRELNRRTQDVWRFSFYISCGIVLSTITYAKTNIPTKKEETQNHAWFSCAHAHPGRKTCSSCETSKRTKTPIGVMFKKNSRLSRKEVEHVLKHGRRIHSQSFSLVYIPTETHKLSVVVGKKIEKLATKRNALRRCVYHAIQDIEVNTLLHGVVLTKPGIRSKSTAELLRELNVVFSKVATRP